MHEKYYGLILGKNNHFPSDGYWLFVDSLNLSLFVVKEWNNYVLYLSLVGIWLSDQQDTNAWDKNKVSGEVTTKLAYNATFEEWEGYDPKW